ncbi:hypothetical protein [Desulfovibrio inopinatus]|uniref:hypothetical protein n=1 Tax=Desulfovibrio inopinatus TaxID=102109 RepID=UPI00042A0A95|nr:hypothetical protein [Desulfovibrio inopinatus]
MTKKTQQVFFDLGPNAPALHSKRKRRAPEYGTEAPLAAIRRKCLDCSGGVREEVTLCPAKECPLHPFRLGHSEDEAEEPSEETPAETPS